MESQKSGISSRNIVGGSIGSVLEWYDFAVYGFLAPTIGQAFFPAGDPLVSLLSAFGVFAAGYAARPIGGFLFGWIGDKLGRKAVLSYAIIAMGASTCAIGFLPTYDDIGRAAPIMLIVLRVAQGLSMGGEFPGAMVFLVEHAPPERRGFYASWVPFGSFSGILLGSAVAAVTNGVLGAEEMHDWGWRVPFLLSAAIAVTGIVLRHKIDETPAMRNLKASTEPVLLAVFRNHWRAIIRIAALALLTAIGFNMFYVFAVSDLTTAMHVPAARALDISTLGLFAMLIVMSPAAMLSDRIGRKPVLLFTGIGLAVVALPAWWLMHHSASLAIAIGLVTFSLFYGAYASQISSAAPEMLPAEVRVSGTAIGYNLTMGFLGGTTPLVSTYLVLRTGSEYGPVWYFILAAVPALIAVATMKETAGKPLI
jgi:MHS family proline/betaine transporter-like MFS transporter